jgi:hypothetical protein
MIAVQALPFELAPVVLLLTVWAAMILAICALVLSAIGLRRSAERGGRGVALVGLVLGTIATVILLSEVVGVFFFL